MAWPSWCTIWQSYSVLECQMRTSRGMPCVSCSGSLSKVGYLLQLRALFPHWPNSILSTTIRYYLLWEL